MCIRYLLDNNMDKVQQILLDRVGKESFVSMPGYDKQALALLLGEMIPTQMVPVVGCFEKRKFTCHWTLMRWGMRSQKHERPILHARGETMAIKNRFKEASSKYRCVLPANAYFEQSIAQEDNPNQRSKIYASEVPLLWMAGLYQIQRTEQGFKEGQVAVVTQASSGVVAGVHYRMPLILSDTACAQWLEPGTIDWVQDFEERAWQHTMDASGFTVTI
jgi:putative SOS response-associated peptidase YedK